jgi:hypothetical protein
VGLVVGTHTLSTTNLTVQISKEGNLSACFSERRLKLPV